MPTSIAAWHSLKTKITVTTLLIFVLSIWTLSFLSSQMLRRDMERQLGEQQFSTVSTLADALNSQLRLRFDTLSAIAAMLAPLLHDGPKLQAFLENRAGLLSMFNGGLMVYGPDCTAIADVPVVGRSGVNYADRDSVVAALGEGRSSLSRPAIGKMLHAPTFLMTVAIRDALGNIVGAFSGVINLGQDNFLDQVTQSVYGHSGGYLIVAPQHQLIVSATDKSRVMESSPPAGVSPVIDRFHSGYEGSAVYVNPRGVEMLASNKYIPLAGWYVAANLPVAEAFAPIGAMQHRTLLITLFLTLLAGALIWWVLRRQLSPLLLTARRLSGLAASQDYPQALPVVSRDEIGDLIGGFNHLLAILQTREIALKETETHYRELFNEIPVGYHEYDVEGRITRVNPTELAMLGYAADEMLGRHVWDFVDDSERSKRAVLDKIAGELPPSNNFERSYCKKDGSQIPALTQDHLCHDRDGRITGIRSIVIYVAERKQAEEALRISEERYRTTFQASLDAININRLSDGMYVDVNRGFTDIVGYGRDEAIGHTSLDLDIWVDPAARQRLVEILQRHGECPNFEARFRRKNGELIWGLMSAKIMELAGVQCIVSVTRDITEIKATQDELERHRSRLEQIVAERTAELRDASARLIDTQFAMDGVGIGIEWVDHETGALLYVNQAACDLLGYSADEFIALRIPDIDPNYRGEDFRRIAEQIRTAGHMRFESAQMAKGGRLVPVELTVYFQRGVAGLPARHIVFLTDITQRKESQRALLQAKEAAEAANLAKSTFLANMSHEIRTPLNGIVGMAHILRRGDVTPIQAERLGKIDTAAEHLLATINDILDLSKIEAGKIVLEEVPVDIDSVLANVNSILIARAQAKGLDLRVVSGALPLELVGDPTRLQQALLNYAANAVKFTECGSVTLRCSVTDQNFESVLLRFDVADTGIGIAADALPRLFAPFEQAESSTSRRYGGSGLGLAISRRLAESMGGEAGVESREGVGSTFWFTARLKRRNGQTAASAYAQSDAERIIRESHRGRRVLVVDDESLNLEVARFLLEDIGLAVDTAEDGVGAIDKAGASAYAVILMDMQMPNLDGLKATGQIRALPGHRDTPILAMTANAFADDKARCLQAGMNDFLAKPFHPEELFSTLLEWLEKSQR